MPDRTAPSEIDRPQRTAVLLIAHGSRRSEANDDLVKLATQLSERSEYDVVQVSYLELASPSILDGGRACVAQAVDRILMLPFFLSAGRHVTQDLEDARTQLSLEFPAVEVRLCPHLGLHPLMTDIVLARLQEGSANAKFG